MTDQSVMDVEGDQSTGVVPWNTGVASGRGPVVLVLGVGLVSTLIFVLAGVSWLIQSWRGVGGYNSGVSAMIAGAHVMLALVWWGVWWLTRGWGTTGRRVSRAGLAAYLFLSGLVYPELALGWVFWRSEPRITPYESAPVAIWRMKPNYVGLYNHVVLRTNGDGFRSPTISETKPEGGRRIVCLGDSLTFGHRLDEEMSYPRRLEGLLRQKRPDVVWEVINAGVEGYSTFQSLVQLKRSMKYKPNLVILLFCLNDVTEKYVYVRQFGGTGLGYHGVADGAAGWLFKSLVSLRSYSALVTAVTPREADAKRQEAYDVRMLWEHPETEHIQAAWSQAENELDELIEYCRGQELPLVVAVAPYVAQFEGDGSRLNPQRRLTTFLEKRHVPVVDLYPELIEQAGRPEAVASLFYLDYSHFSATGSLLVAETMVRWITGRLDASSDGALGIDGSVMDGTSEAPRGPRSESRSWRGSMKHRLKAGSGTFGIDLFTPSRDLVEVL